MASTISTDQSIKSNVTPVQGEPTIVSHAVTGEPTPKVEQKKEGQHHFLVCLDPHDDAASQKALSYSQDRLALPGDTVILVSVLPSKPIALQGGFVGISSGLDLAPNLFFMEEQEKIWKHNREDALKRLYGSSKGFKEGVDVHVRLSYGAPIPNIIEACDYHKCDMVITGRRKMGRIQTWLSSGSVSTGLLTNSDCSVLVVR